MHNKASVLIHPVNNKRTTSHTFKNQAIMTTQHRAKSSFLYVYKYITKQESSYILSITQEQLQIPLKIKQS